MLKEQQSVIVYNIYIMWLSEKVYFKFYITISNSTACLKYMVHSMTYTFTYRVQILMIFVVVVFRENYYIVFVNSSNLLNNYCMNHRDMHSILGRSIDLQIHTFVSFTKIRFTVSFDKQFLKDHTEPSIIYMMDLQDLTDVS